VYINQLAAKPKRKFGLRTNMTVPERVARTYCGGPRLFLDSSWTSRRPENPGLRYWLSPGLNIPTTATGVAAWDLRLAVWAYDRIKQEH